MSDFSPSKSLSPLKSKKGSVTFYEKLFTNSPKSLNSEKEFRARATIRKLLEDEAERNEELSEENEILENQIKSLVALLVEKDEKLSALKNSNTRPIEFNCNRLNFVLNCLCGRLELNVKFAFLKILEFSGFGLGRLWVRRLTPRVLDNLGRKLVTKVVAKAFKVIFRNFGFFHRILRKRAIQWLNIIITNPIKKDLEAELKINKMCMCIKKFQISQTSIIKSIRTWKNTSLSNTRYKTQAQSNPRLIHATIPYNKKHLLYTVSKIFKLSKKKYLFDLITQVNLIDMNCLKQSHKKFLTNFASTSKVSICFTALSTLLNTKLTLFTQKLLYRWKSPKPTNIKVYFIIEALRKILSKKFLQIFKKKSVFLPCLVKKLWENKLKDYLDTIISYILNQNHKNIELNVDYTSETLENVKIAIKDQQKQTEYYQSQILSLSAAIESEKNAISSLKLKSKQAEDLCIQLINKKNAQTELFESSNSEKSLIQERFAKENSSLQENIKKQQEFYENANSKLKQLIEKYEKTLEENEIITSKNTHIQTVIKKLQESFSVVAEEKIKAQQFENNSKQEINSLISTSQALEEEIQSLKGKIKASEIDNLKEKYLKLIEAIEETKFQVNSYERSFVELNSDIESMKNTIETEDFKTQELNSVSYGIKTKIPKTREETGGLKYSLKDSSKNKHSSKPSEDLNSLGKKLEDSKQSLQALKSSNSSLSSSLPSLQNEIQDLKSSIKDQKKLYEKKKTEISLKQNKISLIALNIQESKKQASNKLKANEDLESYIKTLENQVQKLENTISKQSMFDVNAINNEKYNLALKADKLQEELNYVNEEATQRRQEVAQVITEINNYANILAAIEGKIAENENKILETNQERDKYKSETRALRSRYINLIL